MLDAAVKLERFAAGRSLADYLADDQLQWSVERGFEIIGEAMSQLNRIEPEVAATFTEHRKIISFRNVLIHGYSQINHRITYEVVTTDLPVLRAELEERMAGE